MKLVYCTADEYLNEERIKYESQHANNLFENRLEILPFKGKHEVNVDVINGLV